MLENIKILLADENIELFLVVEKSIHAALGRHDYATAVSLHVKDQVSPLFYRWCVAKIVKCLQYSEASWASWPGAAPAGSKPSKFFTMHSVEACLCWYNIAAWLQNNKKLLFAHYYHIYKDIYHSCASYYNTNIDFFWRVFRNVFTHPPIPGFLWDLGERKGKFGSK